ncbi:MAG: RNA-binding S4 domain-containing protein [Clostridiales bacterium]|nr:RNA-binding S4 domain-containing protein [Clostridiales bacterium]
MLTIKLKEEYIKLGQALKAAGLVDTGAEAKFAIQDGQVKVNAETEYQRGKKLHAGDQIFYQNETIEITE